MHSDGQEGYLAASKLLKSILPRPVGPTVTCGSSSGYFCASCAKSGLSSFLVKYFCTEAVGVSS